MKVVKRQRRTIKSIVEIDLKGGYFAYGQILVAGIAFFDYRTKARLTDFKVLIEAPILFVIEVYDHVITKGQFLKVGKIDIRDELDPPPNKFIHDEMNDSFELYNPITGEITASTKDEARGLECSSVWEAEHVEERIKDHYTGKENHIVKDFNKVF